MSFLKRGKKTEKEFASLFKDTKFSTESQDINQHWDLEIKSKIDVKGLKKINRKDSEPNENYHWVEIKNVNGDGGWLYGEADYFAFETKNFWIIVSKEDLQDRIAKKTIKIYTDKPTVYHLYQRKGRKDIITIVPTLDLMFISTSIIEKDEKKQEKSSH